MWVENCDKVTDAGLGHLAKGCPLLQNINLTCCKKVTDAGLEHLAKGCPSLQNIDLGNCDKVTDAGLGHLAKGCPLLQNIDLSGWTQVSDAGLAHLLRSCPKLQPNQIIGADAKKGDEFLAAVGATQPDLQDINLEHYNQVTDTGLGHLAKLKRRRASAVQ